ncbi:MAG: PHP domain-containing protein [Oscillospiraceae bacterium]|nr:PHP domain-containing protein [Oscillospiraceae bacterium]
MEYLYETHMHTSEVSRCALISAAQQVTRYKQKGYTGIIVTDHFINGYSACSHLNSWEKKMKCVVSGYEIAKRAGEKQGLDVFLGSEFTIRGADFLTYGLDLEFLLAHPNIDKLGIEQYSKLVRKNGGYLAQAHPYRDEFYIEHNYPVAPHLIDGVEVHNANDRKSSNEKAFEFAQKHNLPMQAGNDSHGRERSPHSGIALPQKAKTIHDIIRQIKSKEAKIIK